MRYRSLDAHAVEDVVSEVFLRVWQDRQRLDSVDNYRPYLKSIARNVAADGFRRAARTPLQDLPPDLVCRWPEPHAVVAHEEFSRQVDHALAHLADSHRMAIQLAQEGLSSRQSASLAGCTSKASQRRLEKARQALRDALSHCGTRCVRERDLAYRCPAERDEVHCIKWHRLGLRRTHSQKAGNVAVPGRQPG